MGSNNRIRMKKKKKKSKSKSKRKRNRNRSSSRTKIISIIDQIKAEVLDDSLLRFTRPFEIGFYSPGTAPDRIPYHLYLLVKEAASSSLDGLARVEKKICFFCDFFYSHLPVRWKYNRRNATSLIAGCDAFFTKGGPNYNLSSYTPLGDPVIDDFDFATRLSKKDVFEIMSLVHSRKTPTPETFMDWGDEYFVEFYCKLCSCFGIDYHRLETASEDDVILMNMGTGISRYAAPFKRDPEPERDWDSDDDTASEESSSDDDDGHMQLEHSNIEDETELVFGETPKWEQMRKLSGSDEPFELSRDQIREILSVVRSRRLPPFTQWNEYQISFYLKMCSCFGVDYQHLEAAA